MTDDAIICAGLTKRYAARSPRRTRPAAGAGAAVDGLDLRVGRGELFGLLGPNGAGKTTTIGMLTTRVVPTSGRAVVAGVDVVAAPDRARARLAVVTQASTLDRSLTVFGNLYFHGRYFGMSRAAARRRAGQMLERFRLGDRAKSPVGALSGGLAQRLQIARSLLHDPDVLLLDEPTAGLDPQSRLELWDVLRELNRGGTTIVLTTHYMEEADQLCERVGIIDGGRLLALDTPGRLKGRLGAERVITVELDTADPSRVLSAVRALPAVSAVESRDRALRIRAAAGPGLAGSIAGAVAAAGGELRDLSISGPALETVFLALTGQEYRG